jgi:fimbrial isopeptide formation D2 family protein/uncharacterized repeat protein (TIGR01451 family)
LLRVNPRARKSITLSWVVLFVLSLLLQYAQLASPRSTLAVHDLGLFELDGNAVNQAAAGGDWDATLGAQSTQFIHDLTNSQDDDSFTGGSTKDDLPLSGWLWKQAKVGQPKNDIADAFAAAYTDNNGDTVAYFGLDKIEADGNNFVGFWFFKNSVGKSGSGAAPGSPFTGNHTVGDILVLANYTNGGSVAGFDVYKWVGSGGNVNGTLQTVENGGECGETANDDACGKTNAALENSPWPFQGRDTAANRFGPGTFFEGGINLSALGLDTGCFTTFLAETRSSQSVDATLSDFAIGEFSFCETPELVTAVNDPSITIGGSVVDTATLTGTKGTVTGTIEFFVCGPSGSNPACATGGSKVGATKTLSNGAATSDAFTPAAVGHYCFRAEYTPAAGSHYLATSHTNLTTECFNVTKKQPAISTTASGAVQIGATINDVAHLTGGFNPTGTITFRLYGPDDATCANAAIFTSTVPVSGNDDYTSGSYTTTAAGTFRWIARYSGDANNIAVSGSCNDANEDVVVGKLNPTISTTASADVTIGGSVHDVATLSGATANATGTITFRLYGPDDATCAGTAVFTTTAVVSGNGDYTSASFAPTAIGTYRWIASYSGDANNEAVSGACNDANESVDVNRASPSITTTASADIKLGGALTDTAHLTGGFNPTGTITFKLYGPNDANCSGQVAFTSTVPVSGNGDYTSASFTPTAIGIYRWIASYSGDVNNAPATGACNDANETVSVSTPHIQAEKTVDGVHASQAEPGDTLHFEIVVTNTGDAAGDATVTDDISALLDRGTYKNDASDGGTINASGVISWPTFSLAANGGTKTLTFTVTLDASAWPVGTTELPNTVVVIGEGSNCPRDEGDADCDTTTTVNQPALTIVKDVSGNTGGTDPILGVPSAKIGDTLLYTLTWTLTSGPVHNSVITDKLPDGMTSPTNISNGGAYDASTNTITWQLGTLVDPTGSVTYNVKVTVADAALPQPLVNVATIDSDETEPDSDDASVAVPGEVQEASPTPTPRVTPPNTSTDDVSGTPGATGGNLTLILLILGAVTLVGILTPTPATVRRRARRD